LSVPTPHLPKLKSKIRKNTDPGSHPRVSVITPFLKGGIQVWAAGQWDP